MSPAASERPRRVTRPPTETAPRSGAAGGLRRTARQRTIVRPRLWPGTDDGLPSHDPLVRRYWSALIGPGAVGDLLRLIRAAEEDRGIRRPVHMPLLAVEGLVREVGGRVEVRATIPPLGDAHRRRLPPLLQRELDAGYARRRD